MNPRQAAKVIGCSPCQVRWLIRQGKLAAFKRESTSNQHGYEWEIAQEEAERVRRLLPARGRPRGPMKGKHANGVKPRQPGTARKGQRNKTH